MRRALETAERSGRPEDVACAYLHLAELLTGPLNVLEEGVVVARRGAERMAELGLGRTYETRLLAIATNGLFRVGQWAEAEKVVAAALRHRPSGADAVELLLARCRLSVGYGDVEAADRDLDAVATVLAGGGARHVIPLLTLRAGLAMWQGRHDLARQAVQRGLTESRSDDVGILAALVWHGLRAEAEAHAGRAVPVDPDGGTAAAGGGRPGGPQERARRPPGARRGGRLPGAVRRRAEPPERAATRSCGPARWRSGTAVTTPTRRRTRGCGRPRRCWPGAAAAPPRPSCCARRTRWRRRLGAVPLTSEIRTLAGRARVSLEETPGHRRPGRPGRTATNWRC